MRLSFSGGNLARYGLPGLVLGSGLLLSGCTSVDGKLYWAGEEPKTDNARQELLQQQAQREAAIVKSQIAGLEQSQARLVDRLDRLDALNRDSARMRDEIAALRRDLEQMRIEHAAMRKEIVDDLTARINKYMAAVATGTAAGRGIGAVKQNGYMHTVVAGQKLVDIAKAYKTTSVAIRKANNLKDDSLKAGQTLFIPE
ncbi:MAG: LysM peptidoglycan-binding domain-containing protein [bacterium]